MIFGNFFHFQLYPQTNLHIRNILLVSFKNMKIYIIFVVLLVSLKKISIVCYNMRVQNIYTYSFNQNQKIIKTIVRKLYILAQ